MKKRLISLATAVILLVALVLPCAFAESYSPAVQHVSYNGKTITGFDGSVYNIAPDFQPGDDLTITVYLHNDVDTATAWYIDNSVVKPFEDAQKGALDGSYTYELTYNDSTDVFRSGNIGGEERPGIQDAINSLSQYVYLGKIPAHGQGKVVLHMAIDGETQNNDYWNTLAQLQMSFAVEKTSDIPRIPKTSDKGDFIIWGTATVLCAALAALIVVKDRKKDGDKA